MTQRSEGYFRQELIDGVMTVVILDSEIIPESKEELFAIADRLSESGATKWVVLNLANVQTIRSAAIGILIHFQKRVRDAGGTLKICRVHPDILRIFELTRTDQVFDIEERQRDAIEVFHGRSRPRRDGQRSWFSRLIGKKSRGSG